MQVREYTFVYCGAITFSITHESNQEQLLNYNVNKLFGTIHAIMALKYNLNIVYFSLIIQISLVHL